MWAGLTSGSMSSYLHFAAIKAWQDHAPRKKIAEVLLVILSLAHEVAPSEQFIETTNISR